MSIKLTEPQTEFILSDAKYPAFVGGLGSGKTQAGAWRAIRLKKESPTIDVGYYLPTYGLIHDIIIPRFTEIFETYKIPYNLNQQHNYFEIMGCSKIIMRSMDRPEKIIGYETCDAILDELDTLPHDKAADVWGKVVSRTRKKKLNGKANTRAVVTTPEGFRFVYEKWKKTPMAGSVLIKAPTWSNPFLPDDYVDSLRETMSENLLAAYLDGEFVNMANATVYSEFDRTKAHTNERHNDTDALHIGMDFNVGQMSAVIHVIRDNKPRAVLEYTGILDTPAMIAHIKSRHPNNSILVYPDASGNSRKSVNASESDLSLLRQAGFNVLVNSRNPAVRDRVMSMNAMFKSGDYLVNVDLCPNYVESLEKQAYDKNGEPDKTSGFDHLCFSGDTLVKTPLGIKKIKDISESGYIMGHNGNYVRYKNAGVTGIDKRIVSVILSNGDEIKCTPEHEFLTDDGLWTQAKYLKSKKLLTLNKSTEVSCITNAVYIFKGTVLGFIEKSIKTIRENCLLAGHGIFITLMGMCRITISKILNYLLTVTILKNTCLKGYSVQKSFGILDTVRRCLKRHLFGMVVKKVKNGTKNTCKKIVKYFMKSALIKRANIAKKIIKLHLQNQNSVQKNAKQRKEEKAVLMILKKIAKGVIKYLWPINMQKEKYAVNPVMEVKESGSENVYCLTVPKYACFSLKNGVIVSNCDSGGYFITYRYPIVKDEAIKFKLKGL